MGHYIKDKKGDVLNEGGKVIGEHNGAFFFTIGERHGFNIIKKTPNDEPYYVISKDIGNNTITVVNRSDLKDGIKIVKLENINFNQEIIIGKEYKARSRYREELQNMKFIDKNTVEFEKAQFTISSGQSLVVYDGEYCLGGGIIK